ncbi:RICIN domain-containing protein [Sediminicola sp. 1XM1-17]|uniref:RICIN domain-containing protein n=1 Tax=Sediminicola sp. 1XM1-17 TaxID=3127702 RepID=UPI00307849AA
MAKDIQNISIKIFILFFLGVSNITIAQSFQDKVLDFNGRYVIEDYWQNSFFLCGSDSVKKLVSTYDMYAPGNKMHPTNDEVAQTFFFEKQTNGMYRIKCEKHNHYLVVNNNTSEQLLNTFHQPSPDDKGSYFELEYDWNMNVYKIKINGRYLHLLKTSSETLLSTKGLPDAGYYEETPFSSSELSYMFNIRKYFDYDYDYMPPVGIIKKIIKSKIENTVPGSTGSWSLFLKPAPFEERQYISFGGYSLNSSTTLSGDDDGWTRWDWSFEPVYNGNKVYYRLHNLKTDGLHGWMYINNNELKCGNPTKYSYENSLWELERSTPLECIPYYKIKNVGTGQYIGTPIYVPGVSNWEIILGSGDSPEYEWHILDKENFDENGNLKDLSDHLRDIKLECRSSSLVDWGAIEMDTENYFSIASLDTPDSYLQWNKNGEITTSNNSLLGSTLWKFKERGFLSYSISSMNGKELLDLDELILHPFNYHYLKGTRLSFKIDGENIFTDQNGKSWIIKKVEHFDIHLAFAEAKQTNTIKAYNDFKDQLVLRGISQTSWFMYADWEIAQLKDDASDYLDFANKYPPMEGIGSNYFDEALWRNAYMRNTAESYTNYINSFPLEIQGDILDVMNPPPGGRNTYVFEGNNIEKAKFRRYTSLTNINSSYDQISNSFEQYLIEYPDGNYRLDLIWAWLDWAWKRAQGENHPEVYQWYVNQYEYIYNNYYLDFLNYHDKAKTPLRFYAKERSPTASRVEKLIKDYEYLLVSTLTKIEVLDGEDLDLARIHSFVGNSIKSALSWNDFINNATPIYNPPNEFEKSKGQAIVPTDNNWNVFSAFNDTNLSVYSSIDESDVPSQNLVSLAQLGQMMADGTYDDTAGYIGDSDLFTFSVSSIPLDTDLGLTKFIDIDFTNPGLFSDDYVKIRFHYKFNKFTSNRFIEYMKDNNLACPKQPVPLDEPTDSQLVSGPGYIIRNETNYPVFVTLSQPVLGPIYYEMVQPGKIFFRRIGELPVTFNIDAYLSLNGEEEFDDVDVLKGILGTVAETSFSLASGGATGIAKSAVTGTFKSGLIGATREGVRKGAKLGATGTIAYLGKYGVTKLASGAGISSVNSIANEIYNDLTENNNECLETTLYFANSKELVNGGKLQVYSITGGPELFCYDLETGARTLEKPKPLKISDDAVWQNFVDTLKGNLKLITDEIDALSADVSSPYINDDFVDKLIIE